MRYILLLTALMLHTRYSSAQSLPELIPYFSDGLYGYADTNGNVVITPKWKHAYFFEDGVAIVRKLKEDGRLINGLIDKHGNYIIAPAPYYIRYTGLWGHLNIRDEDDRWGMIDNKGDTIISLSHTWQRSEPIQYRHNDYNGADSTWLPELIKDYRSRGAFFPYKHVTYCCGLDAINAVKITDTGYNSKHNANGVLNLDNKVILPMEYDDIYYAVSDRGEGFKVSQMDVRNNLLYYYWIDKETGDKTETEPGWENLTTYTPKYGYLLTIDGDLLNRDKENVLPGRNVYRIAEDTIYAQGVVDSGQDSTVVVYYLLNTKNLQAYTQPDTVVHNTTRRYDMTTPQWICSRGIDAYQEGRNRYYSLPYISVGNRLTKELYLDSFKFSVSGYAAEAPIADKEKQRHGMYDNYYVGTYKVEELPIVLSGTMKNAEGYQHYSAIVDKNANYIVPPGKFSVTSYNADDGLATVVVPYTAAPYRIVDTNGKLVAPPTTREITGAFRWQGTLYTYTIKSARRFTDAFGDERKQFTLGIGDSIGHVIPSLRSYKLINSYYNDGRIAGMIMQDAAGMAGIITPEGEPVFPAINFKHKYLVPVNNNMMLAGDSSLNRMTLRDPATNKELYPGLVVAHIESKTFTTANVSTSPQQLPSGGLFNVKAIDKQGGIYYFFIDRYGRAYNKHVIELQEAD